MCGIAAYISHEMIDNLCDVLYPHFKKIAHRGPDDECISQVYNNPLLNLQICFGFYRLAVNGLDAISNQPLYHPSGIVLICNGELYTYKELAKQYDFDYKSNSDCEIILHLYERFGMEKTLQLLDGEFAFVLLDLRGASPLLYAARDNIGKRFIEVGYDINGQIIGFCSEMKGLQYLCHKIHQLEPGHYVKMQLGQESKTEIIKYTDVYDEHDQKFYKLDYITEDCLSMIRNTLIESVKKTQISDRGVAYLLSGGLDSNLTASIAQREKKDPINTYTFTFTTEDPSDPPSSDALNADIVAKFLGTKHTLVAKPIQEGLDAIETYIWMLESYDVTTIRAGIPMHLLCKYIKENTEDRVIITGEGPDEIGAGYLEFHGAPGLEELQEHTVHRTKNLQYYDLKRGDRSTAGNGLEGRYPYLNKYYMNLLINLHPKIKHPKYNKNIEKYVTRLAFDVKEKPYLPDKLLWRPKEAFSDGVGYKWKASLIKLAESKISDDLFAQRATLFPVNTPMTKEGMHYRMIYNKLFPGRDNVIPGPWMPKWVDASVTDPSATVLKIHSDRIASV